MNNSKLRSVIGALLTVSMLSAVPLSALSYTGLGEVTSIMRDTVGDGLLYSELVTQNENGKTQLSYIFEYDPAKDGVLPIVRWGSGVYGKDRLGSLVTAEDNEGKTVLGAVNGDFYSMQTGVPMGVIIDGGKLISTDDSKYALGFLPDGSAIVGKPSVTVTVTDLTRGSEGVKISHFNKYPTVWGAYMLNGDFSDSTHSSAQSLEIVVELDGELTANGSVKGTVREIVAAGTDTDIPEGCAVICVALSSTSYPSFKDIAVGSELRIDTECSDGWEQVVTAIGGGDLILADGRMPEGIIDEDHEKTANPRTAVGIKPNGSVVFFAVDGRTEASRGLKLDELSAVMAELGCVVALNLDGGGSTTVMVKPSSSPETAYVNVPADGSYRSISNGILFVSKYESDGKAAALSITPNTPYVLRNSTVTFSAQALDSAYLPIELDIPEETLTASFAAEYASDVGSVSANSFKAGMSAGEYRLTLSDGTISGDVSVIVTDKLHDLSVKASFDRINPGSLAELDIAAFYNGKRVICDQNSFYYTLNGEHIVPDPAAYPDAIIVCELGYITKDGNFQSFGGDYEGQVEIGVWFDEFVRYVTLEVSDAPQSISDFESDTAFDGFEITAQSGESHMTPASHGHRSSGGLELDFSYQSAEQDRVMELKLQKELPLSPDAESVKLWIYGNTAGTLSAVVRDENGGTYDIPYTVTKDYTRQIGWRELTAEVPESLKSETLYLTSLLSVSAAGASECTIVIDDALIHYGRQPEPALSGLEEHWASRQLNTLYEMAVIQNYDCRTVDGKLYYEPDLALTRAEFAKILVLWSGTNAFPYVNEGVTLEADTPVDKIPYIRAALANGLMSGRGTAQDGTVIFDANATITREEAFKVIGSMIDAAETTLVFTDAADISDWALSGVSKCVADGVVSGYADGTLRPQATITRAEFAAMLAKMN